MSQAPSDIQDRIDRICSEFEQQWQSGESPSIVDHLSGTEGAHRAELLQQLVGIDLHYRRQKGEQVREADYVARFPDYEEAIREVFQLYASGGGARQETLSVGGPSPTQRIVPEEVAIPGYDIIDEIARGGMGVVYKARHRQLDCLVALKVVLSGQHSSSEERERMLREAKAIAMLQHPNIIHVFEVGEDKGQPYLALELCTPETLSDRIQDSPLPPKEAAEIVEKLARAMQVAHDHGIIHRDLKPSNVLLTEDGTLKITDFGLAKKLDEAEGLTATHVVMGTPSYAPPEQVQGKNKEVDARADLYALGAILYELLTGRPPFKASTTVDTILQVIRDEPVPLRQLNSKVPVDLETICLKCLEKQSGRRYQSGKDLANELKRFQNREPIQARPISRVARVWRWCRRNKAVAGWMAVASALLVTGTLLSLFFAFTAESERRKERKRADAEAAAHREANKAKELADRKTRAEQEARRLALEQLDVARRYAFAGQLEQVERICREDAGTAYRLLHDCTLCPIYLRGAAWRFYEQRCERALPRILGKHQGRANGVCFSPDGALLASCSSDRSILLWDIKTGQFTKALLGHKTPVLSVAFSPDGKTLASSDSSKIKLWDVSAGDEIATLKGHQGPVPALAFSPDGRTLASGSHDRTIRLWDISTHKEIHVLAEHELPVVSLCFSPDGQTLASGSQGRLDFVNGEHVKTFAKVKLWDLETNKVRATNNEHKMVSSLSFSPDGMLLATAGPGFFDHHGSVKSRDARTGRWRGTAPIKHRSYLSLARFSPVGKYLVTASRDQTIKIWDLKTWNLKTTFHVTGDALSVSVSSDGQLIAAGCGDGAVRIWNLADRLDPGTGDWIPTLRGHRATVTSLSFRSDGRVLASAARDRTVRLWDVVARKQIRELSYPDHLWAVDFSSDDSLLAACGWGRVVRLWSTSDWKEQATLKHELGIWCMKFSPKGRILASAGLDQLVKLWDERTWKVLGTLENGSGVRALAFHPDGTTLAAGCAKGAINLWDITKKEKIGVLHGHRSTVHAVCFSPDGRTLVSGGFDRTVILWDVRARNIKARLRGHRDSVLSVCFSPDGRTLVSGSEDGTIRFWDVTVGRARATFLAHSAAVLCCLISPDGRILSSCSKDGTIKFWEISARPQIAVLRAGAHNVQSVCFSSAGEYLRSRDTRGTTSYWEVSTGRSLTAIPNGTVFLNTPVHPNGNLQAEIDGSFIRLIDTRIPTRQPNHKEKHRRYWAAFQDQGIPGYPPQPLSPENVFLREQSRLTTAIKSNPNNVKVWQARALHSSSHQQWQESSDDWEQILKLQPEWCWHRGNAACIAAMTGNEIAYREHCRKLIPKLVSLAENRKELGARMVGMRACCLLPDAVEDYETLLKVAQANAKEQPQQWQIVYSQATVLYRMRRYDEAWKVLQHTETLTNVARHEAVQQLWMAMTYHQRKKPEEAQESLKKAIHLMEAQIRQKGRRLGQYEVNDFVEAQILRREAEGLILDKKAGKPEGAMPNK